MKLLFLVILYLVINAPPVQAMLEEEASERVKTLQELKQTWMDSKDRFPEIQQQLSRGKILYSVPLKAYDSSIRMPNKNEVVLIEMESQSETHDLKPSCKAIFKPRSLLHQKVEQGAFEIAQFLNMRDLISPTVIYKFKEEAGVLSYYIDVEDHQNPWKTQTSLTQIQASLDPKSLNNFYTFAYVFGLWDLKWVNTIFVGQSLPYSIMSLDNESLISAVYAPLGEHFYVC